MSELRFEAQRLASPDDLVGALLVGSVEDLFPDGTIASSERDDAKAGPSFAAAVGEAVHCASVAGRERLEAVREGRGLVVSTGQQPQLFGGPLYVLYKGLTAVREASEIERRTGLPCLAIFWVAADDHDWEEVASVDYLDRDENLRRLKLPPTENRASRSVGPSLLPDSIHVRVAEFLAEVETDSPGAAWVDVLRDAYSPGRSFTEAFITLASSWFRDLPIAFLDAAHPDVRRASVPLLTEVIERDDQVRRALGQGAAAVEELGFEPQLAYMELAIPMFRDGGHERFRLRAGQDDIRVDARGTRSSRGDLIAEIQAEPGRFSPSAALRPVLESRLLPVARTVLGPGEIAYWAQLHPLFSLLDAKMPAIRPRDSWLVIETRVERLLGKVGISAEEARDPEAARRRIIEENRPTPVVERLTEIEEGLGREYEALAAAVGRELPGLRSAVGKSRKRASDALGELRRTVDRAVADRESIVLGQLDRIVSHLYPGGVPQERRIPVSAFVSKHGDGFLDAARRAAEVGPGGNPVLRTDAVAGTPPPE
jgi:bacillithiol biosynthesis cysteine-adding enzyme BshC